MNKNGQGVDILIIVGGAILIMIALMVGFQLFTSIYDVGEADIEIDEETIENIEENVDEAVENITENFNLGKLTDLIIAIIIGLLILGIAFILINNATFLSIILGVVAALIGLMVIISAILALI